MGLGDTAISGALQVESITTLTVAGTLTLTGATVAGSPTWSSNQAITLSTAAQPNVTSLGTLTGLNVSVGTGDTALLVSTQAATDAGLRVRTNQANSSVGVILDNSSATNAVGGIRLSGTALSFVVGGASGAGLIAANEWMTLSAGGVLTLIKAASQIVPGVTSLSLRNNANNADNLILTDAGNATIRGSLTVTGGTIDATGAGTIGIGTVSTGRITLGAAASPAVNFAITEIASGTTAIVTLGNYGGAGRPTAAAQDGWLPIQVAGVNKWIPVWA